MKDKTLYILWGCGYLLCAGLGFIPNPTGAAYGALFFVGLLFFIPPSMLLYRAIRRKDLKLLRLIRGISLGSLIATFVAIVLNIMSYSATAFVGDAMHALLVLVSVPMMCGQVWMVSMFCWACLMYTAWTHIKKN
jgi:hypothetical protein